MRVIRPATVTPRRGRLVVLLCGAALSTAWGGGAPRPGSHPLLDVPYVTQTPALCGGAAVAMVLRYWGERGVFAQDFASLVRASDAGIPTGALASAVLARGWRAAVVSVSEATAASQIASDIDRGRPLIVLIEVAPHTYHYVVIVGLTGQQVVVHDPARAPFRVLQWAEFDRVWAAAGRWMLLVLPPEGFRASPDLEAAATKTPTTSSSAPAPAALVETTPCDALVDRGVSLALAGDRAEAEEALVASTRLCADDPASWLELAGFRFSQSRWSDARDLALTAIHLAPDDAYAWQLLANSCYRSGDVAEALQAWNRTGEPRVDAIAVHGATRTRQPVIIKSAGLEPRQVLTPDAFGLAERRLGDLPALSNARIRYAPATGGLATVDITVDERSLLPHGWLALGTIGARALLFDEVHVDVAGPLGAGDMESVEWRWAAPRPRVALALALPSPRPLPGIISVDASWERQTYEGTSSPDGAPLVVEERRRGGLHLADWATHWLRWQTGAALDRFGTRDYAAIDGSLDARLAGDRLAFTGSAGWWAPFAGGDRLAAGGLLAAWRSTTNSTRASWSATTAVDVASESAPLALWPGAGTGQGRSALLRAHPLLEDNIVSGPVFGRTVAHGTIEYARPVFHAIAGALAIAGFVDAGRAWRREAGLDSSPLFVDAGVGLRVRAPGDASTFRLDVAHGLRGGGTTLSVSLGTAWPR
jgi:hypothetical protein